MPPALVAAALGLALAYAPPKARLPAAVVFVVAASIAARLTIDPSHIEIVFIACWTCVVVDSASVHLRGGIGARLALGLALISGILAGAVVALSGSPRDLLIALPCMAIVVLAGWLVATGRGIIVKIVSSWLIAIAILSAALPLTPTPGYAPDHME